MPRTIPRSSPCHSLHYNTSTPLSSARHAYLLYCQRIRTFFKTQRQPIGADRNTQLPKYSPWVVMLNKLHKTTLHPTILTKVGIFCIGFWYRIHQRTISFEPIFILIFYPIFLSFASCILNSGMKSRMFFFIIRKMIKMFDAKLNFLMYICTTKIVLIRLPKWKLLYQWWPSQVLLSDN